MGLVDEAKAGDPWAKSKLYDEFKPAIAKYSKILARESGGELSFAEAQSFIHDAFARSIRGFSPEKGVKFSSYAIGNMDYAVRQSLRELRNAKVTRAGFVKPTTVSSSSMARSDVGGELAEFDEIVPGLDRTDGEVYFDELIAAAGRCLTPVQRECLRIILDGQPLTVVGELLGTRSYTRINAAVAEAKDMAKLGIYAVGLAEHI